MPGESVSSASASEEQEAKEKTAREREEAKKREFERMKHVVRPRRRPRNVPSKFRD